MFDRCNEYLKKIFDFKVIIIAIIAFVVIHGEMIFNKLSWGDDMALLTEGTFRFDSNGRWLAMYIWTWMQKYAGVESTPAFVAAMGSVAIALSCCIYLYLFKIKNLMVKFACALIFVSIPSIAVHLGYMITTGMDYFGFLITVVSVLIISDKHECKIWRFILASIVLCLALGQYQWHLTVYLTSILIVFIYEILTETEMNIRSFLLRGLYLVGSAVVGLVLYLGILQWYLKHYNVALNWYAGIDTYGVVSVDEYIRRFKLSYTDFWNPVIDAKYSIFPFHNEVWHIWLLRILILGAILVIAKLIIEKKYFSVGEFVISALLIPMAFNFNFILYGETNTHGIHMYHYVLLFVLIVWMYQYTTAFFIDRFNVIMVKEIAKLIMVLCVGFVILFGVIWARYDNVCYLTAELHQSQAVSYLNRMIARMESTEGYYKDIPIAIIGDRDNIIDNDIRSYDRVINPYQYNPINCGDTYAYLKNYLGYQPAALADPEEIGLYTNEEFLSMPCYPSEGSIKIIDGVLVVKCYYEQ